MDSLKTTIKILLLFLVITFGLLFVDYQFEQEEGSSFFTNLVQNFFPRGTITPEVLQRTSLKENSLLFLKKTRELFSPYLKLPENAKGFEYELQGTSILITEVNAKNPFEVLQDLLKQENADYTFNRINEGTFYLNQTPDKKTHNFLAIVIGETLFGFQYKALDHQKILELVDVLSENTVE